MIIAIRETSRPIPENIVIGTSGWLSAFFDETDDAGICAEMRAAFGISGPPVQSCLKSLPSERSDGPRRRFNGFVGFRKIIRGAGTRQHNCGASFRQMVLIGFRISHDSRCLPRSRTCSSASIRVISSSRTSMPSLWRRASCASSAVISAMKAAASSGPPSPSGSSVREPPSPPADARFRRRPVLVKNYFQYRVLEKKCSF